MRIYIASDHRGFKYKESLILYLNELGHEVIDNGPHVYDENDDYVDYALKTAKNIQNDQTARGILLCGSGIGMYIAANKVAGVRAAECRSIDEAKLDREHHDSNILVLGEDILSIDNAKNIIDAWLTTEFAGGRHERRLKKISMYEKDYILPYNTVKVVPSLLSENLDEYYSMAENYSNFSNRLHIDVMDGEFVKTKSPNVSEIAGRLKNISASLAFHLMVNNPASKLKDMVSYKNINLVYVHLESLQNAESETNLPFTVGLAVNPDTPISDNMEKIKAYSVVLILTVDPGNYGSEFTPEVLAKINELRDHGYKGEIHVDGGISLETIDEVLKYQPDVVNVGSAIHNAEDPKSMYEEIRKKVSSE